MKDQRAKSKGAKELSLKTMMLKRVIFVAYQQLQRNGKKLMTRE